MTDSIQFKDAAKFYAEEPHQVAAWEYLQRCGPRSSPKDLRGLFQRMYRNELLPEPEVSAAPAASALGRQLNR